MTRKKDSERDREAAEYRRLLERTRDDLIASGESLLTQDEWELPSSDVLRLAVKRHEAARATRRAQSQ
jgi:hypothetical protein